MKFLRLYLLFTFPLLVVSCKQHVDVKGKKDIHISNKVSSAKAKTPIISPQPVRKNERSDYKNYLSYFGNKILHDKADLIKFYLKKYTADCEIQEYADSLFDEFKFVKNIDDINGDGRADTVFVMPPLSFCEDGDSYYFFDKQIPRLLTDSYCSDAESVFPIGDIDEDGLQEIGTYYSSCSGRYKSIVVYSLKHKAWKKIGESIFDVLTQDPTEISLPSLVKKIGKGKFKMCNFNNDKKYWEVVKMK